MHGDLVTISKRKYENLLRASYEHPDKKRIEELEKMLDKDPSGAAPVYKWLAVLRGYKGDLRTSIDKALEGE